MSRIRDRKYQKSNKALWDALERLKNGQPISPELKAKPNIKVNRRTVEIEAGMSSGALRNHSDVVDAINKCKDDLLAKNAGLKDSEDITRHKIDGYKARLKKEVEQKNLYADEAKRLQAAFEEQIASSHELIVTLFKKVPLEDREPLMRQLESDSNVVPLHPTD